MIPQNAEGDTVAEVMKRYPILLVDDEEPNRIIFRTTFERDFEIITAASGYEALGILARRRVDVLISDQRMPGMSGIQLCEQVRKRYPDIKRVLVTAYTDLKTATDAINQGGVDRYIPKPWNVDELRTTLNAMVSEAHLSRAVRMLQSTMMMKERLAGVAATRGQVLHDLANLSLVISVTTNNLEQLLTEARAQVPPETYEQLITELQDQRTAVDHLQELHTRVRAMGSEHTSTPHNTDLRDILATARALTRGHLPQGVELAIEVQPELGVFADATDVARIVVNLVNNAAQAMVDSGQAQGRILVRAESADDQVIIRVQDDGPGISTELQSRVFDGFFTTRARAGGSGLGLAICMDLAGANGGEVQLERSKEGEGSTFAITLPAWRPDRSIPPRAR